MIRNLFSWVDWNHSSPTQQPTKWKRIHSGQIADLLVQYPEDNIFTSIQNYKTNTNEDGELQFTPIYFDLDYPDDVEVSLMDARALVTYFSQMDIGQEHIRVWFSGSKGFHIVLSPEVFGIKPHEELTYVIKGACTYTAIHLKLRSFDTRVYSIRRLWRLPDSRHAKTGLYCTELTHKQLDDWGIDAIRTFAKERRGPLFEESEYDSIDSLPVCVAWFSPFAEQYQTQKDLQNLRPKKPLTPIPNENPVCITDLLANSIRKPGTRNQAEMALISYYKDAGVAAELAQQVVGTWVTQIPKGLTSMTDRRSLESDVKGVIRTVYDADNGDRYHFACHFIRALGTGTERPIACVHEKCKFVNQEDQEPVKAIELKLKDAARSVYVGKRVITRVMVSGRDDIPYVVPVHFAVKCKPDMSRAGSVCHNCSINAFGGSYEFKFGARNKRILNLIETTDVMQRAFLRKQCGIPDKCPKHTIEVLEYTNLVEVMLIPRIDFRPDTIVEDEPYVYRRGYFVGHDIESNREYEIVCYTHPDPKNQHAVHVIEQATALTDDVSLFQHDATTHEMLKKFQVEE